MILIFLKHQINCLSPVLSQRKSVFNAQGVHDPEGLSMTHPHGNGLKDVAGRLNTGNLSDLLCNVLICATRC